jgi:hypothetical protein
LASIYQAQGKYPEAEEQHHRALAIKEKVLGSEHPDVVPNLNYLARLYHQRAVAIREKVERPKSLVTTPRLENDDTSLHYSQLSANPEKSEGHTQRVLAIQ